MSDPMDIIRHFRAAAQHTNELEHEVLQHLVAAGTARGWFPSTANVKSRFEDHASAAAVEGALARLQENQLVELDPAGKIDTVVGGITHRKTDFVARTAADGVKFHLNSALDALTIAPTLQKRVTVKTTCPVSQAPIEVAFDRAGHIEDASPRSFTAFLPGWSGRGSLYAAQRVHGRLLADDRALEAWQTRHRDPPGMPLGEDTIRFVGHELASTLSSIYVTVSVQ